MTLQAKFDTFRTLHSRDGVFVMPNVWDAGSTRILTSMGFEALATTSAGFAFSVGKRDSFGALSRKEILTNASRIVVATDLPVSADLEEGFGASPEACAKTVELAMAFGLVGGSIEDATGDPDHPIFDFSHAVERVAAAAEVKKDRPFLLTARAEGWLYGDNDLAETIRRLQAFCEAGADVVYAPGLPDIDAIRTVCREVPKPVNVLMGLQGKTYSVRELEDAGAKRISVGGSFARAALGALKRAAHEVLDNGTFSYAQEAMPDREIAALMAQEKSSSRGE